MVIPVIVNDRIDTKKTIMHIVTPMVVLKLKVSYSDDLISSYLPLVI